MAFMCFFFFKWFHCSSCWMTYEQLVVGPFLCNFHVFTIFFLTPWTPKRLFSVLEHDNNGNLDSISQDDFSTNNNFICTFVSLLRGERKRKFFFTYSLSLLLTRPAPRRPLCWSMKSCGVTLKCLPDVPWKPRHIRMDAISNACTQTQCVWSILTTDSAQQVHYSTYGGFRCTSF